MKDQYRSNFPDRQKMIEDDIEAYYYSDCTLPQVDRHTHDCYEILYFLEGEVTSTIDHQQYHLQTGDILIIPPHTPHQMKILNTDVPYRRFTIWISSALFDQLKKLDPSFGYLEIPLARKDYLCRLERSVSFEIQSRLLNLIEGLHKSPFGLGAYKKVAAADIFLTLSRALYDKDHPQQVRESVTLFDSLLSYINIHIHEELSLDGLASLFYVSKYYLSHLFKEQTGQSLYQYIIKKRLNMIRTMILAGEDISRACEKAGFKNYSNFYRAFVREYGISPKEYRDHHRLENNKEESRDLHPLGEKKESSENPQASRA